MGEIEKAVEDFLHAAKHNKFLATSDQSMWMQASTQAAEILLRVVLSAKTATAVPLLLKSIRKTGAKLHKLMPLGMLLANVTRRILHIVRDEYEQALKEQTAKCQQQLCDRAEDEETESNSSRGSAPHRTPPLSHTISESPSDTLGTFLPRSNSVVGEFEDMRHCARTTLQKQNWESFLVKASTSIRAFASSFETMTTDVTRLAVDHIYEGEDILTFGFSHTLFQFFVAAAAKKTFKLYILENAPLDGARKLEKAMKDRNVDVKVLPDSAAFAVMSKVSKVFVGTHAVLANGGLLAAVGSHLVAMSAKHHSVPLIVVTMTIKTCPYYPVDQNCSSLVKIAKTNAKESVWATYEDPSRVIPSDVNPEMDYGHGTINVMSPTLEYVPQDYVSLFVTDNGEHTPSYIYSLLRDHFHPDDADI